MQLFYSKAERIELLDGWIYFDPNFISSSEAQKYFEFFETMLNWSESSIKLFGMIYQTPRLEAYYAETGKTYSYSGKNLSVNPITNELKFLKEKIESQFDLQFNAILANLYRNGTDSNGWHADDEIELGINPQIASLSFGTTRRFDLKHNKSGQKLSLELNSGSLLIMGGKLQHHWKHQIAKTKKVKEARINLTFRKIS